MAIIWVWKLGCKMNIFKNVKSKCPFAGKHGTEWVPTACCPVLFIPYKLNLKENLPLRESFDSAKVHLTEKIKRLLLLVLFYDLQLLKCTVEKKVQRICIWPVEKHKTRLMESGSSTAKLISSISPFQMRLRKVESC